MGELKWDKRLETGITAIDSQHKEIFRRIDNLGLAILNGKERAELIQLIRFLEKFVIEHFSAEEQLLREIKYPDYLNHCEEHKKFREMCNELVLEYQNKGADLYLAIETDKKMIEWWEKHILKSDLFFIPFYNKHWDLL